MRRSLVGKLAFLALLAFVTSVVTKEVIIGAQAPAGNPAQPLAPAEDLPKSTVVTTKAVSAKDPAPKVHDYDNFTPHPSQTGHCAMREMKVWATGTVVHVLAKAFIFDKRPNISYVWELRVYQLPGEALLSSKFYDHQMFKIFEPHVLQPTFEEAFELPPGKYNIAVLAHGLPEGSGVARLQDKNFARRVSALGRACVVTIQPD